MADAKSVVELVFQGVDKTGEATQAALKNAQNFSASVQNIAAPIADATLAAAKFEAALLATGAAVTAFAIKTAGDFDTAFREISTLIDAPIDDLQRFRQEILDYSTDSTASLEQITGAVYSAISAGVEYTDSLAFLRQAEELSIAGRADLNDSLLVLVSTLNAYGVGTEEAARFSDLLFTAVREGQTTLPELADSLASVTGLAATAGVGFDELLAAVATLTSTGTPTSQAITQIQGAIAAILKPTEQAKALAEELGIEFNIQRLEAVGLEGILKDVAEATGGNSDQMARLFGRVEALNGVLTLTGLGADKFAANLEAMEDSAGATGNAYEKMSNDIEQSNQRLGNALRNLLIQIGQPLLDEYGSVTAAIAEIFNTLGVSVQKGELGGLVEFIESLMADLSGVLEDVARNLPAALESADLSGFTRNIEAVLEGVQRLLSGVDISTEDGLRTLIEGVGAGFARLGEFVGAATGSLGPFLDAALKVAETIVNLDEKWFQVAGTVGGFAIVVDKVLGPALDALLFILVAKSVGGSVGGIAGALGGVTKSAAALLPVLGKAGLVGAAGAGGFALGTVLADAIDKVIDRFTGSASLGSLIYDLVNGTEEWTTATVGAAGAQADAADSAGKVADAAKEVVKDYDAIVNEATLAADSNDALTEAFAQVGLQWDSTSGQFRSGIGALSDLADASGGAAESAQDAEASTRGWVETLVNGVPTFTQAGRAASAAFDGAGESAEDAVRKTEAYILKMEELASNERIALIEAKVQIDVAQIEADTRRVEAAFESINASINSTGELLGSLFGELNNTSRYDQNRIINQIELENERRQEALDLQKRLVEAEIRTLDARAQALERGNSLIQIDGAGLQPHLEAFMWEILRTIQTRVNEDGLEMLLGTA